ncbi:MAG: sialate O-acetylesterase [Bacteroidetes bacterium]|nr:sialate O-acetylesterase [Bacteroidota bacterium]
MKKGILFFDILGLLLIIFLFSRKHENGPSRSELVRHYDVILVIGQSNTHQGVGYDPVLDKPSNDIKPLGRFGVNNYRILQAAEPLDHFSRLNDDIGFALTFAKEYRKEYLEPGSNIIIIPGGMGATGFGSNHWNAGDTLYQDAVKRTNFVLEHFNSRLVAILWHQGESDVGSTTYGQRLDSMIIHLRKDIVGNNTKVPFILGGMVPYWVDQDPDRILLNRMIENTVSRIENTGFADPRKPFLIEKPDNEYVSIHFDAKGQRELGRRYFAEYRKLVTTGN